MEDERLALVPFVLLDFPEKNNMITALELADIAADKMGRGALQQGTPRDILQAVNTLELVPQRG